MTDLSFNNYISRARENLDGTVRVAKGDDSQLINHKGGFGNKLATFFKNIGSAFGFTDASRVERNQTALQGFRQALTERFGADIANKAWDDKKVGTLTKLTGKTIIEVANHALALRQQNRATNDALYWDCRPIDYSRTDYPGGGHFGEICKELGYDLDLAKTLTPERFAAYKDRLEVAFNEATQCDNVALTPERAKAIACDVLKQVASLDLSGGLGEAQKAREAYVDSVKTLVTDIADGRSPRRLLESLVAMNKCGEQLLQREGLEGAPEGATRTVKDQLRQEAILQIGALDASLLRKIPDKIFGEDSSTRALYGALDRFRGEEATSPHGQANAGKLSDELRDVISTMSALIGTHTDSRNNDVLALSDNGDLGRTMMRRAGNEVETYLSKLRPDTPVKMLSDLKAHLGKYDGSDMPLWHSTETLVRLEDDVREYARLSGLSIDAACGEFREAIRKDHDLPFTLKEKLGAALNALQSQEAFKDRLAKTNEFSGLSQDDSWKLFMNGNRTHWDLEQVNQGSLSGLYESFTYMLASRDQEINGEYLESLQKLGCKDSFNDELKNSFDSDKATYTEEQIRPVLEWFRISQGFREGTTSLTLDRDKVTLDRMASLENSGGQLGYRFSEGDRSITLEFTAKTKEECQEQANAILQAYRDEIGRPENDEGAKLTAIGRAVQDLYCSHLFEDGNTRTVVVNLMNRMLLDNGLSPCILSDPKAAANCSLEQFVERIREGQETFRSLCN